MGSRRSSYAATWWFGCVGGLTWGGVGWWAWWVAASVGFVGREGELSRLQAAVGLFQALGGGWSPTEKVASAAADTKH